MNPPNTTLEARCAVFVKEEFTESDLGLDFGCTSTDFTSQPVKSEDGAGSREDFDSVGQFQMNSLSSPIKFSPQIKLERKGEDDYEDQLHQNIHDLQTELCSQPSDIGMDSESGGKNHNFEDTTRISCPDFTTLATASQSSFNLSTQIKCEGNDEDNTEVDPLHTIIDIKNEVSPESPDCLNDHETEVRKHAETNAPCAPFNCLETSTADYGRSVIDHIRLRVANAEITNDTGGETSRNEPVKKKFPLSRRGNGQGRKRTHTNGKPFSCSECSACFVQMSDLKRHMLTHSGEKPFSCSHCSACFSQEAHLKLHMRTHTGEKPFSCSHCSARFTQKSNLTGHMRTHTGDKPFRCSHCSACFTRKGSLNRHVATTHTGEKPFSCCHCAVSFCTRSDLKRHMRTHTGEKPAV